MHNLSTNLSTELSTVALTQKQLKYAELTFRGVDEMEAALDVGYKPGRIKDRVRALERDPDILKKRAELAETSKLKTEHYQEPSASEWFDDPVEFYKSVMNDKTLDMRTRMQAAKDLAALVKTPVSKGGKKEAAQQAAEDAARPGGRFATQTPPKLQQVK